jgi:hypothetical protein
VFESAPWIWASVDLTLVEHTAGLIDEEKDLRQLVSEHREETRYRVALRALDKQLTSNLSLLGLTPSDRSRLGLVQVKTRTKLDELMERKHGADWNSGL